MKNRLVLRLSLHRSITRKALHYGYAIAAFTAFGVSSIHAADVIKANNTDNLNLTNSWVGGVVPGAADVAVWDNTITGGLTNFLGANLTFKGVRVANPAGPIQIGTGSTLTIGNSGIDLSAATQDLSFSNAVAAGGGTNASMYQKWLIGSSRTLTLSSTLTKNGVGSPSTGIGNALIEISTTGVVVTTNISRPIFNDSQNNPFVLYGPDDWAATDGAGNIVAAAYTPAVGGMTANTINDVQGDISLGTVDVTALRFNDPVPRTVTITGTSTHTARGILVTANSGGGLITGGNIRPSRGASGGGAPTAFPIIQNSPSDFTIASSLAVASSSTAVHVIKYGKGNLILSGTAGGLLANGGLTVMEGTVTLSGTTFGLGTNAVNQGKLVVRSGVALSSGANLINSGGTNAINVIAANGQVIMTNVTHGAGSTSLEFVYANGVPMSTTTAPLFAAGPTFTANSTINISVISGGLAVGQFPLIKYTAIGGAGFAAFNPTVTLPPHIVATLSNNVASNTIDLVVTSVLTPLKWATGSGTWDTSTPNWKDTTGATATYQQAGILGDSVLFEDSQSGGSPITVTLNTAVVPAGTTFSNDTKTYTLSGSGSIGGIGGVTKAGAGSLTIATANTFPGGLNVNGGVTTFSANNNLGVGPITFGGGTLRWASGNTTDISLRTVTLGAGGGTLDIGANTITFAAPIGNSGSGSLTKAGSGTLTLTGPNTYSGLTLVTAGTIALANPGSVSNSVAIVVNGGTGFDVGTSGNSLTLNGAVNQILAGSGTVTGPVTAPASTTISPATNGTFGTLTINGDLALNGSTYACDISQVNKDLIVVGGTGNLTISGGTLALNVTGTLANGSYKLIQYSGGLIGSSGLLTITGFSQPGKAASLSDAVPGEVNLVISDTASDVLTWAGTGNLWDLGSTFDWLKGATPWAFTNGDLVTFDDSGSGQPFVSIMAAVAPSKVTVNGSTSYVFDDGTGTGGGKITGAGSLVMNGSGTISINTINDNTGPTVINAGGTVQVAGSIGTGNITNNGTLNFGQTVNRSVPGTISGNGALNQQGGTTLTLLANNNNYSGAVSIGPGAILQVGDGGTTGGIGSGATISDDGTLVFNKAATYSITNSIVGSGNFTKSGAGTVTLTASNSYAGATTINNGKLVFGSANAHAGNGALIVQNSATNDINGNNVTAARLFNSNSASTAGGRIVNNSGSATNDLTINYDGTGAADTSMTIADNDGSGGRIRLIKEGTGTQILRGASTYSGGTIINAGALQARQQDNAFGVNTNIILNGGTLDNFASTLAYAITTTADSGLYSAGNCTFTGPWFGTNTITVTEAGTVTSGETISWGTPGQLNGFSGRFVCTVDSTSFGRFWRWAMPVNTANGSPTASWELQGNVQMTAQNGGYTIQLGSLEGVIGTSLNGNNTTYIVGGLNTSTVFSGIVLGSGSFVKAGTGTLTLDQGYTFTGSTVVSNGILHFVGGANPTNSSAIRVASNGILDIRDMGLSFVETNEFGEITNSFITTNSTILLGQFVSQTLSGSGTILGSVIATNAGANTAVVAPGDGIGTLTIATNLTVVGATLTMELNRANSPATNDMIQAQSITGNGIINVVNLGPDLVTGDKFKLFSVPVSGFTVNLPPTNSTGSVTYAWTNRIAIDGTIQVLSGASAVNTTPTNLTVSVGGGSMTLSWPTDHIGWRLQAQTNALSVGLKMPTNSWFDVTGSSTTNQVSMPIVPANGAVFFRLTYP